MGGAIMGPTRVLISDPCPFAFGLPATQTVAQMIFPAEALASKLLCNGSVKLELLYTSFIDEAEAEAS